MPTVTPHDFPVELPAGGPMHLQSADEVELWEQSLNRYRKEYPTLIKMNDLVTLGSLLQQQVFIFRAQTASNGMEPEVDNRGVPTGAYKRREVNANDLATFQRALTEAQKEMGRLEKVLGIDKATRESGGAHTVGNYIAFLKQAAHARAIHICERTLAYESFVNQLKWRMRMLVKSDAEDKAYHNISPSTVLRFVWDELQVLEEIDKDFAHQQGKLFVGKL